MGTTDSDAFDWPLVLQGDEQAFGRVFDRHADLVYRFVKRRTGDVDLAEDIVGQVFLEAWRQRSRLQLLDGSLRSWMLGVASNLIRRHWRSVDRARRATDRIVPSGPAVDHADFVAASVDGHRELVLLRERMAALPDSQIEVLLLWAWEQLSYQEIATALDIPVGTVRSRLARARTHMKGSSGTGLRDRAFPGRKSAAAENDPPAAFERRTQR